MDTMDLMNAKIFTQMPYRSRGWCRAVREVVSLTVTLFVVGTSPVAWAQAPQLVSVTPANGATGVTTNAAIVFVFDQPMDTAVDLEPSLPDFGVLGNYQLTGSGLFNFLTGTWSQDGRTLTCTPTAAFPANATIGWTLNPAEGESPFTNEDGTEALATVSGSFSTGTGGGGGGSDENCDGLPDEWGGFNLFKGASYEQTSAADPVPEASDGFYFGSSVTSPQSGAQVTEASVILPDNSTTDMSGIFGFFVYSATADLESALEAVYPPGRYTVRFTQTGEPERSINMTMPANNVPVPKILNYPEAQAIVASQDFPLRWNSFTGADADDYLSISVSEDPGEVVFEAPDLCLPRELAVTATSVVIPADTLIDGQTYSATLSFGKVFYASTNAVPGMSGFGGISRVTTFRMHAGTGGSPNDPARLSDYQVLANGNPEFRLTGTAGQTHTIERTDDLTPTVQWTVMGTVTLDGAGQATFEDTGAGNTFPLFYRAVAE